MVRVVQVDEIGVQQYADQCMLKRIPAEIGIVVGRSTASKDMALQLIRSPDQDNQPAMLIPEGTLTSSKSKPVKLGAAGGGGAKAQIDEDWVVEHAAQLSRTLPGGLDILGVFILCEDRSFQASHGVIVNLLKGIEQEVLGGRKNAAGLLVLHINIVSAKVFARELSESALKPCEVKSSSLLPNMMPLRCQYRAHLELNLADARQRVYNALEDAVAWEWEHRISPAVALVNGATLASYDVPIAEMSPSPPMIELLTPIGTGNLSALAAVGTANSSKSSKGTYQRFCAFHLSGTIDCRAYVYKRENVSAAIEALKIDAKRTLLGRIAVLREAAEMATVAAKDRYDRAAAKGGGADKALPAPKHPLMMRVGEVAANCVVSLPRRASVAWQQGGGSFCDYLVDGEGVSEVVERLIELTNSNAIDPATFQCEEQVSGKGDRAPPSRAPCGGGGAGFQCNSMLVGAVAIALLATFVSVSYLM